MSDIDELISAGKYSEAARLAEAAGKLTRATELFERVWDFAAAARTAEASGDLSRALRNAIDSRQEPEVDRLINQLRSAGDEGRSAAASVLEQKRRFADAAPLVEQLGQLERAAEMYRQGHLELDAARLLMRLGRDNEAGRMLERVVAHTEDGSAKAQAHFQLGQIFAQRLRHDESVRHLQEACKYDETRTRARLLLVVELAALGLRDAARDVLILARREDPELPSDVDEMIRIHRPAPAERSEVEIIGGRYRLAELIGSGGAGRVFRAHDEVGNRQVAVKLFSTSFAHGHQGFERFVREARIASALKHPNLVEAFDFSADHGFLVMEYLGGGSLAQRLTPNLSERQAKRMVLELCDGLELAHRRGIIHRDIKPANIFFDSSGSVKLGDFGVAHLLDLGQTQTGGLIGTLAYMSPEQITGAPLTIAADLYSVGITLFQALTGQLPFLGPDFVAQHLGATPPQPSEVVPKLSAGWDPILSRLLAKSPSERFDSIDKLRRAIKAMTLSDNAAHKPLILPRASARHRRVTAPVPVQVEQEDVPEQDTPRYQFETPLGATPNSKLSRAVDSILSRSVIIERYVEGGADPVTEGRLYALAKGGGPFLQRALAYNRTDGVVVLEAPSGSPINETESVSPRRTVRLLKRLARALAPVHREGCAHGMISENTVVIDELGFPTILVSGLGPAQAETETKTDIAAIAGLIAAQLGTENTWESMIGSLAPGISRPEQAALLALCPPKTGEELYRLSDALEIALLRRVRRLA